MIKGFFISIGILLLVNYSFAQTNTFPSSGNVGIGTTSPASTLEINSNLSSSNLLQIYNAGILRYIVSYTGTQVWYLNNTISEAGSI